MSQFDRDDPSQWREAVYAIHSSQRRPATWPDLVLASSLPTSRAASPIAWTTPPAFLNPAPYTITWGGHTVYNARWSDAALYSIAAGVSGALGKVARTTGDQLVTINQSNPYFAFSGQEQGGISNGWFVYKMGRTTGWTYGNVTQSCYDQYRSWGPVTLWCQFKTDYLSNEGDSGGPVFAPYAGGYIMVGIHHSGAPGIGATFSGFRGIEMDMLGSFDTGRFFAY